MKAPRELDEAWHLPALKRARTQPVEVIDLEAPSSDDDKSIVEEKHSNSYPGDVLQTPPRSTSDSPLVRHSLPFRTATPRRPRTYCSVYPPVSDVGAPTAATTTPLRLPSLKEFEQGVEDLIKFHGSATSSPPPAFTPTSSQASPVPRFDVFGGGPPHSSPTPHDRHFYTHRAFSSSPVSSPSLYASSVNSPRVFTPSIDGSATEYSGYPSPPLEDNAQQDGEAPHINKKYTTEEGDFIIYALNDKKQKWATIKRDFATIFGSIPQRTMSGLQAWYYRMNLRIPVWDEQGWLIFDNEEDEEPRTIAIKCRQKASEGMGLAQRYPERLVQYSWADEASKLEARDWAHKRLSQLTQRAERRRNMAFCQLYD